MNALVRLARIALLLPVVSLTTTAASPAFGHTEEGADGAASTTAAEEQAAECKREERREFQSQELMLAKSGAWIFKLGETPRILWRDVETVRRLGCSESLQVRWFDAELNESPEPDAPGRWLAWIVGTAPNGTPIRRSRTFYALPKQLPSNFSPDLTVEFPHFPGPEAPAVLQEHEAEIVRVANDALVRAVLGSEQGAVLVAGLTEAEPLGRPARFIESTTVQNDDCHLALKLKIQGMQDKVRSLRPPRHRDQPATVLHVGSPAQAGVAADAKSRIDAVCRSWAEDTQVGLSRRRARL